jgi:hypothetical protein
MALATPRAVTSDKYLVVYDFGTTSFAVTNGYSVLFEGETDFPILDAAVADTGHFALITSSQEHLSQVVLYDANFNLVQRISRNSAAVTDVCISSNGKYVAFCALTSDGGASQSVVELYRIGGREPTFVAHVAETALSISFTDARHLMLVTPSAGYAFDLSGAQKRIDFGGNALLSYDVNRNGCVFLLDTDPVHEKSRVILCDKRGDVLHETDFEKSFYAAALGKDRAYLLGAEELWRIPVEGGGVDKIAVQPGAQGILLTDGGQLRLVRAGSAEYVEFD